MLFNIKLSIKYLSVPPVAAVAVLTGACVTTDTEFFYNMIKYEIKGTKKL